ncbi:MAG: TIGR03960 family B12-binding radical SAM protein [Pseudanabaenaceae cyanobacterium bins.68]|nr:TIGR03960 family B12-binding radical SAM protein [Pseudanabaenaceae cyanobacterium bins.68]
MSHPLITPEIRRPARYLGNEYGAVHKPWQPQNPGMVRWCLTYPELYEVGASNLGHVILYRILNEQADQLCDRAYLPDTDLATKLRAEDLPLFAVESGKSLGEFDILGFSLSYELGATNILEMLDLAQIPLTWAERQNHHPLIFAGGQTATSNPEPYADFFDFFALGDGEEVLPEIGAVIHQAKLAELGRQETLLQLAQVPGVYVPQFYDWQPHGAVVPNRGDVPSRILRRVATPRPEYSIGLVPLVETVHDRLTIEIRRGCTRGCRFCQPGMLTRPARDVAPEQIIQTVEQAVKQTGYTDFSLLSLSCSDYLALPAVGLEIKNRLTDQNVSLSLPSQRVDRFDQNIAKIIGGKSEGKQQGLTFAPEAGTQRLRDVINKGLTDAELWRGIKTAHEQGWDKIKLYFMIGLPTETDEDVLAIAQTIGRLQQECHTPKRKRLSFNLTISNFTPKPHTPFQWHQVSTAEFLHKQNLLRQALRSLQGVKVNFTSVEISAIEDFLGRADRAAGVVIKKAWQLGAGMDAWYDQIERAYGAWTAAIADAGITWENHRFSLDQPLPWDHIDTGISKKWLLDDWYRAIASQTVDDCSFHGCSRCGICGPNFGHNQIEPPLPIPTYELAAATPEIVRVQKVRLGFGKLGSMAMISHLDLMRLWERALRRAQLPIAYSCGFNPQPRLMLANALALGYTSSAELIDLEFVSRVEPAALIAQLSPELGAEIPLYHATEIPLDSPAVATEVRALAYSLQVQTQLDGAARAIALIDQLNQTSSFSFSRQTKSGRTETLDLRPYLLDLQFKDWDQAQQILSLSYVGKTVAGGITLKPDYLIQMLTELSGQVFQLKQVHRDRLILLEPSNLR